LQRYLVCAVEIVISDRLFFRLCARQNDSVSSCSASFTGFSYFSLLLKWCLYGCKIPSRRDRMAALLNRFGSQIADMQRLRCCQLRCCRSEMEENPAKRWSVESPTETTSGTDAPNGVVVPRNDTYRTDRLGVTFQASYKFDVPK